MTIQQMFFIGSRGPYFVAANNYSSNSTARDTVYHTVPASAQNGDMILFIGSYEWADNRWWFGPAGNDRFILHKDLSRIWGDPAAGGDKTGTEGIVIAYAFVDTSESLGKVLTNTEYSFKLYDGNGLNNRKISSSLIVLRSASAIGANGAITHSTGGTTTSYNVAGVLANTSSALEIVYASLQGSDKTWTLSDPTYTNIFLNNSGDKPSTLLAYKENTTGNTANIVATHNSGIGENIEVIRFMVE